jgi:hypothetical protein
VTAVNYRLILLVVLVALIVFSLVGFGHVPRLGMSDGH